MNLARRLAENICQRLRDSGHQAYLVGGCVRDILLGREPADYDVSTDATPDRVQQLFPHSVAVGAKFGVIIVQDDENVQQADSIQEDDSALEGYGVSEHHHRAESLQVEVATFRSDIGYSDGRHPDRVVYTTSPQEDVKRRDFTINALLLDLATGEVLDYVGGRDDLRTGIIRAIGCAEDRFREDKLRMARAVRFAARFRCAIEAQTFAAISKLAAEIHQVSPERLRDELTKLLTEGSARRGFELLDETRLLPELLPEIARMKGVEQPPQYHPEGDVWIHTLMMLEKLPAGCSPTLAWGVLLHDVGKPSTLTLPAGPDDRIRFNEHAEVGTRMAEEICRRFRFSNAETEQIAALVANHMRFKDVPQMKPATLKRFVRLGDFQEHLELHRLDCSSSHGHLDNYEFVRRFLEDTPPEEVRPPRLISGSDLIALGLRPGPEFKGLLDAVEEAQLDGTVETHEDALEFIRQRVGKAS
ncbi:MAG TPA: CCA tRNA nucleotidyltransferase [Candidatus Dormibacteraeota bacterium]|nr:CCA tRNA nucleotidyltransferase [Candidatus Dormibacteraeota bacterium]